MKKKERKRERRIYACREIRARPAGWWIVATKVDGHERAFSFLFDFSFCSLPSRHAGHTRDATPHCCLRSIDRSIPPHRGYRGERRGACSLPHDKCVAFLRVIALLQSMLCCACTRRYLTSITELRISANGGAHPFHGGQPPWNYSERSFGFAR